MRGMDWARGPSSPGRRDLGMFVLLGIVQHGRAQDLDVVGLESQE